MRALRKLFTKQNKSQINTYPELLWGPLFSLVAAIPNDQALNLTNITLEDVSTRYEVRDSYDIVIHDWHFGRYPLADDDNGVPHHIYQLVNHSLQPYNGDSMCLVMLAAVLDSACALDSVLGRFPSIDVMSVCSSNGTSMLEAAGPRVTSLLINRLPLVFKQLCSPPSLSELTAIEIFHVLTLRYLATLNLLPEPLLDIICAHLVAPRTGNTEEVWTLRTHDEKYMCASAMSECRLSKGTRNKWSFFTVVYKESKRFQLVVRGKPLVSLIADDGNPVDCSLWETEDVDFEQQLSGASGHLRIVRLKNCTTGRFLAFSDNDFQISVVFESLSELSKSSIFLLCKHR